MQINDIYTFPEFKKLISRQQQIKPQEAAALVIIAVYSSVVNLSLKPRNWLAVIHDKMPELDITESFLEKAVKRAEWDGIWHRNYNGTFSIQLSLEAMFKWAQKVSFGFPFVADAGLTRRLIETDCYSKLSSSGTACLSNKCVYAAGTLMWNAFEWDDMALFNDVVAFFDAEKLFVLQACFSVCTCEFSYAGCGPSRLALPMAEWVRDGGDVRTLPTLLLPFLISETFARGWDVRSALATAIERLPEFVGGEGREWLPFLVLPELAAVALAVGDASAFEAVMAATDQLPADDKQVDAKELSHLLDAINSEVAGDERNWSRGMQGRSLHLPAVTRMLLSMCRNVVDGNVAEIGEMARVPALFFSHRTKQSLDELTRYGKCAMAAFPHARKLSIIEQASLIRCATSVWEPFLTLCVLVLHVKNASKAVLRRFLPGMGAIEYCRYQYWLGPTDAYFLTDAYLSPPLQNSTFIDLRDGFVFNPWHVAAAAYGWSRRMDSATMDREVVKRATELLNTLTQAGYAGIVRAAGGFWSTLSANAKTDEFLVAASVETGLTYALFAPPTRNDNWAKMLNQLAKTFSINARKKKSVVRPVDTVEIRWVIESSSYSYGSTALFKVGFGYIQQKKNGTQFTLIMFGRTSGLKQVAASMSAKDRALWDLVSAEYERRSESWEKEELAGIYATSPVEILDALAAVDNVYVQTPKEAARAKRKNSDNDGQILKVIYNYRSESMCHEKACVVKVPIEVVTDTSPGGGMILRLSRTLPKGRNSFIISFENPTRLVYSTITDSERKFERVIDTFGINGQILLPPESLPDARRVLAGIAAHLPVGGTFAPEAMDVFEQVRAEPVFIFKLKFSGESLEARRVVKVHPALEETIEPGVGKGARVVKLDGRTVVMMRDLENERERDAEIQDVMRPFSDWEDEKGTWRVVGLSAVLDVLDALHNLNDKISLEWDGRGCRVVRSMNPMSALEATERADHWFSVRGSFKLDDGKVLSFVELLSRLETARDGYVKLDDETYFRLTKSLTRRLEALGASGRVKGDVLSVPPAALPMLDRTFAGAGEMALPDAMRVQAEKVRKVCARSVVVPERLRCDLRSYQVDGYRWLSRLTACGFGVCLADDMGLGKTVQIIALLLERAGTGASLVVAPASLVGNWRNELYRFAPTLTPVVCGAEDSESRVKAAGAFDVVIASYGLTASRIEQFSSRSWNGIVLDEAQAIKNHLTQRAKSVRMLAGEFRVVATGTPVENRLSELWSLFDFLNPGLLSTRQWFLENHTCDGQAKPSLKKLVSPLILRRLKRDVLDDLPEKTEITLRIPLTDAERHAYEGARLRALDKLSTGGEDTSRISILAELTRLRRFCCHPSLVIPDFSDSSKLDALLELLENLRSGGHRALIFSQFTDYLAIVRRAVTEAGWTYRYLDGTTALKARDEEVAAFQRGEGDFFLISLKAGGMGLNLTAANYVILLDPWWNPAVENQAVDRVHRIGQKQPVTVYRLIAEDTVEERVAELHRRKLRISDDLLSEAGSAAVSEQELMGLFSSAAAVYEPAEGGGVDDRSLRPCKVG